MIKVVKVKYLSACDSCGKKCTHLISTGRKYLHVCTSCLLKAYVQCENALGDDYRETRGEWKEIKDESQEQVEQ